MNAFYHWIAKHKLLSFLLFSIVLCSIYTVAFLLLDAPIWIIVLIDLLLLLVNYVHTSTCSLRLVQKTIPAFDNGCDPFPLLQETELLLSYTNRKPEEQTLILNHCAALCYIGEYQKVYDALCALHIDRYAGTLPAVKCAYYNNLMDVCTILGKYEQADFCFDKLMQLYADLKNKKQKKLLEPVVCFANALNCFRKMEYARTIEILNGIKAANLRMEVSGALLCARAYLVTNDVERAKEKLRFVIARGNKLFSVVEARKLLENCTE